MAKFTEKAILSTFQEMLDEMPFDKITVSEIVKRCEISSNTFYYHFRDIYDLMNRWLTATFHLFFYRPEVSLRDALREFLHSCQNRKKLVYHLANSLSRERAEQYFFLQPNDYFVKYVLSAAGDKKLPEERVSQLAEFCRYSVTGFFFSFLWKQMNGDIDSSVDCLADTLQDLIECAAERTPAQAADGDAPPQRQYPGKKK